MPIAGLTPRDGVVRFGTDASTLLIGSGQGERTTTERLDVRTGVRRPWNIIDSQRSGEGGYYRVVATPDGRHVAFSRTRVVSTLYLFEGLR